MRSLIGYGLLVCSFTLSACGGKDAFIAEKVKFKALFAQQIIQVSFLMNPDYQIKQEHRYKFDRLGNIFLKWDDAQKTNELGSNLFANRDALSEPWPIQNLASLHNGTKLPDSVPYSSVNNWPQHGEGVSVSLIYQYQRDYIAGGSILSSQFGNLPANFIAEQNFRAANGDVIASLVVLGPTSTSYGGIYFFGNFGTDPFAGMTPGQGLVADDRPLNSSILNNMKATSEGLEWEMDADSPLEILSYGRWSVFSKFFSVSTMLSRLDQQLKDFAGQP